MKRLLVIFCCALLGTLGAEETAERLLNRLAGTPFCGDGELWQEPPSRVVRRLNVNCRAENTGRGKLFAARVARLVFGVQAAEIRIFVVDGRTARIDVFLVNKGDSAIGNKRRGDIRNELRHARSAVEKLFRENLGRPRKIGYGTGTLRRQLPMWTRDRYALAIDCVEGEYLIVRIAPPEAFSSRRRNSGEQPQPLKNYSANVRRLKNGDVFIADVPMVDQGRKGYCVPATVERVLRYFGISGVDMHKLAEKYKTGVGGRTRSDRMMHGSRQLLEDHGLKMRAVGKFKRHAIVKYVDRGVPVLWFHYSAPAFKQRLDFSINSRGRATPEGWKRILDDQKRIRRSNDNPHIALIIGYNRETDEFAVSNSWGERYRIAWVRFADMVQADADMNLFVVEPRK